MGEFFDNVVIFLENNYVYVIGVGLIIILMLIGFLATKRKARKVAKSQDTASEISNTNVENAVNDVSANNVDLMKPVDISAFPAESSADLTPNYNPLTEQNDMVSPFGANAISEPTVAPEVPVSQVPSEVQESVNLYTEPVVTPVEPVVTPEAPVNIPTIDSWNVPVEPIMTPGSSVETPVPEFEPIVTQTPVEEAVVTPAPIENSFDNTEIIDLSTNENVTNQAPTSEMPPFVIDKSQYNNMNDNSQGPNV